MKLGEYILETFAIIQFKNCHHFVYFLKH